MTLTRLMSVLAVGTAILAMSESASAQSNSLFGNSGTTSTTGGTRAGTTTGTGSGAFGSSAGGTSSIGQTQTGQSAFGQQGGTTGSGFIGGANNAGRLIGQQNAQQRTTNTNRTFQGVNNNAANNANQNFNSQSGNQSQNTIRPVVRVAFQHPTRTAAVLNTTVTTRFTRLAVRQPRFQGITVALAEGQQVVLKGTVDTDVAKSLAENIARMEPGVRSVRNEIVVKNKTVTN